MAGSVAIAAHNIDEALACLEEAEKEKVDIVKLMITGGVLDAKEKGVPGELKMPPEMVKASATRLTKRATPSPRMSNPPRACVSPLRTVSTPSSTAQSPTSI